MLKSNKRPVISISNMFCSTAITIIHRNKTASIKTANTRSTVHTFIIAANRMHLHYFTHILHHFFRKPGKIAGRIISKGFTPDGHGRGKMISTPQIPCFFSADNIGAKVRKSVAKISQIIKITRSRIIINMPIPLSMMFQITDRSHTTKRSHVPNQIRMSRRMGFRTQNTRVGVATSSQSPSPFMANRIHWHGLRKQGANGISIFHRPRDQLPLLQLLLRHKVGLRKHQGRVRTTSFRRLKRQGTHGVSGKISIMGANWLRRRSLMITTTTPRGHATNKPPNASPRAHKSNVSFSQKGKFLFFSFSLRRPHVHGRNHRHCAGARTRRKTKPHRRSKHRGMFQQASQPQWKIPWMPVRTTPPSRMWQLYSKQAWQSPRFFLL